MSTEYGSFGEFITVKREGKDFTLREMARILEVSAPYLSDVEKDRRNPFDFDRLEKLASVLELDAGEKDYMFDLAGKGRKTVAPDLPEYIMERDYVSAALRTARDLDAGEEEWMRFVEELKQRKG
ncbi:helix-turn-helix domain-containing protein [Ruminococcaceae bacterium OttesenSCG-928-A16]|nr:helix-turn-helix domain-containing protein [Ruminococcaceae bacterium OttesenSCG-928-A16]